MTLLDEPAAPTPAQAAQESAWAAHASECLERHNHAVAAGRRGDYTLCEEIIARCRLAGGEKTGEAAAAELRNHIKPGSKKRK